MEDLHDAALHQPTIDRTLRGGLKIIDLGAPASGWHTKPTGGRRSYH